MCGFEPRWRSFVSNIAFRPRQAAAGFGAVLLMLSPSSSFASLFHPQSSAAQPPTQEWHSKFSGDSIDSTKWERFTFEGGSGGTFKVENGELRMRGVNGARSGVRTKENFSGDRVIVDGTLPDVGQGGLALGTAVLTVLFDDSGRNRIEWILTSEGTFEAWTVVNGQSEP